MWFRCIQWSKDAEEGLANALGYALPEVKRQIDIGAAFLWDINHGESYLIIRDEKPDLVVVAFEGKNLLDVCPHLMALAQRKGFERIRFHTQRPGLIRLLREYNPEPIEYVCTVSVLRSN